MVHLVISEGSYEGQEVQSAWSTRELADAEAARLNAKEGGYPFHHVASVTLDVVADALRAATA